MKATPSANAAPGPWDRWRLHAAGAALLLGVTLGAYLLWLRPLTSERREHESLSADLLQRKRKLSALKEGQRVLDRALAEEKRQLSSAEVPLEPSANVNARVVRLTELAGQCGLHLDAVESGRRVTVLAPGGGRHPAVAIRLTARGSFRDCVRFLETLGQRLADTAVTSADLSGTPGADGPITMTLDLTWYTAGEQGPAGPTADAR